jgi:putative two-component system response regulator
MAEAIANARLLIVDDELGNVVMLEEMLRESDYNAIESTTDPFEVIDLVSSYRPDLILLDLMMPGMDGMAIMQKLHEQGEEYRQVPILVLTADVSPTTRRLALSKGAKDFLTKPFDVTELLLRIRNLLENRFLYLDLERQNTILEQRVRARTGQLEGANLRIRDYALELEEAHFETLERLALAGEFRDDDTGHHTQRVAFTTAEMARIMGFLPEQVRWIQQAARLHDVGKIGISDLILLKPGKLTKEEFDLMKTHTTIGAKLFSNAQSDVIQIAERIAHSHHEWWSGAGYPRGLKEVEIPVEARLLAVADVFDALTHDRPYKKAWATDEAVAEIQGQSGTHFDPTIVEIFMTLGHSELV